MWRSPMPAPFFWRAWAQADLYQTGVLLLDMRMPVMDGKHVHAVLRQRESTLAVVFLTGHGDVPMAVEQMKQGAVDFLQKPVSAKPLQTALERAGGIGTGRSPTTDHHLLSRTYGKRT